jgi:RimJ/RimL family protein N-acetyltransferase
MELTGELVRLRASREEDAPAFVRALEHPEVIRYLDAWAQVPYGPREALEFIRSDRPQAMHWTIECLEDGAVVGSTGLHEIDQRNRHCSWGIWVGPPDRWGRGYGTEACRLAVAFAFDHLGMEKVQLQVYAGNDRARRAYEKAGFVSEGVRRRHIWSYGRLIDVEAMAVFRDHPLYRS